MKPTQQATLTCHLLRFAKPRPRRTVSEWCQDNLIFDEPGNRGPFSLIGREYMVEIMDTWNDTTVTDQVIVSGVQIGKTAGIMGGACWRMIHDPARFFWVLPTRDTAKKFSRTRWGPLLLRSPETAVMVPTGARRHQFSTFEQIVGGNVVDFAWSNSPSALASVPANVAILDEVDKFDLGDDREANALELAEQRTNSFANPKRIKTSTPTLEEGLIWQELLKSDFRRWHCPCPHCRKLVVLAWSESATVLPKTGKEAFCVWDLEAKHPDGSWDLDRVERSAHYVCPNCDGKILDHHKTRMNREGRWIATKPGTPGYRGWHLPTLSAPSQEANVGRLAVKWLTAKRAYAGVQGFINSVLAEPYVAQESRGHRAEVISDRAAVTGDDGAKVVRLMTVDAQARGAAFWHVVREWHIDTGASIAIQAGPLQFEEQLAEVAKEYEIDDRAVAVDAGWGSREEGSIYSMCWRHGVTIPNGYRRCWMPLKGQPGRRLWKDKGTGLYVPWLFTVQDPFLGTTLAGQATIELLNWSTDAFKDALADLRAGEAPWKWTVAQDVSTELYWHHLEAEYKDTQTRGSRGLVSVWKKRSQRWPNHLFDCEVMQLLLAKFHALFPLEFNRPTE